MSDNQIGKMSFSLEVWGRYACFSRPEMKTERVSYDVITPSAARGVVESIYWHPSIEYAIDELHILNPIRTTNIRRNEVGSVIRAHKMLRDMRDGVASGYIATSKDIVQRASLLLRDVRYVIEGHIIVDETLMNAGDSVMKFRAILARRIAKGQCYHQPSFGCREFPAHFCVPTGDLQCPEELRGMRDLGYMLWDLDFSEPENPKPLFYRATMQDGVICVPPRDSEEIRS